MELEKFIVEEKNYRGFFISKHMRKIAEKYDIADGESGWRMADNICPPDVLNNKTKTEKNDSSLRSLSSMNLFDHFYTFRTINNQYLYAVCPYNHLSNQETAELFRKHGITVFDVITPSPYADCMILFRPDELIKAYD